MRKTRHRSYSAPDLATPVIFTDDPLTAGVTIVKVVHFTQLRVAVDAVRSLAGMGAGSYSAIVAGVTTINAAHVSGLRTSLDAPRATLFLPALSYTDGTITPGSTLIKAPHVAELRNGVK